MIETFHFQNYPRAAILRRRPHRVTSARATRLGQLVRPRLRLIPLLPTPDPPVTSATPTIGD